MFERADLFDAPHVSIVGATGSGKTTFAMHLFENIPVGKALFIHQDPNDTMDAEVRIDYEHGDSWDVAMLQKFDSIDIVMPMDEDAAREELARIQSDLFTIARNIPHDKPRFYVFVDEVHEYADLHADDENPVVRMAKRGRRFNTRLYMISQSPADVSKKAMKQASYHVIFAIGTFSKTYFDTYRIPFEDVRKMVGSPEDHNFVVWDDFELHGPMSLDAEVVR